MRLSSSKHFWATDFHKSIGINDNGLVLGAGSILARMTNDERGTRLALDEDQERILALLSVAYGTAISADVLVHIKAAADCWRRGDKALANIRLAYCGLPRLDDPTDAHRLYLPNIS